MGSLLLLIAVIPGGAGWADVTHSLREQLTASRCPPTPRSRSQKRPIQGQPISRHSGKAPRPCRPGGDFIAVDLGWSRKTSLPAPRRFKIRDESGNCVVARLHGQHGDKSALILPDGQLGYPNMLVPTEQPFQPMTATELAARIHNGPFSGFQLLKTAHYLVLFQSSRAFAEDSGRLLEDLYRGLIDAFRRNEIPVHESEFPLVAVIFATEQDFRAHKKGRSSGSGLLRILHQPDLLLPEIRPGSARAQAGRTPQAPDGRARGRAPDPVEHRRPAQAQSMAALAGRGSRRILRHHREYQERRRLVGTRHHQRPAHGHDSGARRPTLDRGPWTRFPRGEVCQPAPF